MAAFHDHFSAHAADYLAYRPTYPPELFEFLASISPGHDLAWDCGTGNGQAACPFAKFFARVVATDASSEQLRHAKQHPRVEYLVAPAESCSLGDNSVDLVCVAQALHWFNLERFYSEVRRVCRPGAVLAAWTYNFNTVNAEVDAVFARLQREFIAAYWPPEREAVDTGYRTLPFPFSPIETPPFTMTAEWTLAELLGYVNTWSAVKGFSAANGYNPLNRLADDFRTSWGAEDMRRKVQWRLVVRAGRVPSV